MGLADEISEILNEPLKTDPVAMEARFLGTFEDAREEDFILFVAAGVSGCRHAILRLAEEMEKSSTA